MKNLAVIFIVLFIIIPTPIEAEPHQFKVTVIASGDENVKNLVQSYFTRELRSLGDVIIDYDDPSYVLSVLVIEIGSQSGVKGYAISFVEFAPYSLKTLDSYLKMAGLDPKEERFNALRDSFSNDIYQLRDHIIQTGPPGSLRNICETIVAQFDTLTLEPARKFERDLKKYKFNPDK